MVRLRIFRLAEVFEERTGVGEKPEYRRQQTRGSRARSPALGLLLERFARVRQTHETQGRGARLQRVGDSRDRLPVASFGGRFQIAQGFRGFFLEQLRHLGDKAANTTEPITGSEIRSMRERARLSQGVFARYLNVTVGYVSQLERGAKRPTGPALVLLNVIRRKGIEAIL